MDQNRMPLVEALQQFREEAPAYFRIPGHRFERGLDETLNEKSSLAAYDLSEAEGLDDLHHAEGVIAEAQKLAAETWKAKKTFFLVNGTTCGNEAMVLSSVKEGEKIIVPRNVHKSVLMGLILSGATPVYVMPEYSTKWQMWGGVTPETIEKAFAETPDAKAVLLVSPTYYGLCSDLQAIAEICHCHNAALLVDEAHGSHLYFSEQLPLGALESGADACAQSIHKTAGSFTQSSFLSLGSGRLDEARVAANLQMVQSTSPSYLLMASLDAARRADGAARKRANGTRAGTRPEGAAGACKDQRNRSSWDRDGRNVRRMEDRSDASCILGKRTWYFRLRSAGASVRGIPRQYRACRRGERGLRYCLGKQRG